MGKLPKHDYIINNYPKIKEDRMKMLSKKDEEFKEKINIIRSKQYNINLKKLLK